MSQSATSPSALRGRYTVPLATSNLGLEEIDFPEFEPFEEEAGSEATPRSYPGGAALEVHDVDMCQQINRPNHYTTAYDIPNLVVRRGVEFIMRVSFSRPLSQQDDFQVEFLIGSNPTASKDSMVVVTFGGRHGGHWMGRVLEAQGPVVTLGITPTAHAIVGKFRTYVAIVAGNGMQRTRRNPATDMYLLFNAWCPQDTVFVQNEAERMEYVLNDHGIIYMGSANAVSQRNWVYGQFERGILDACIYILDSSRMPISDRGNVLKVVRKGSAMINSQDDNGVLVGNWSEDFSLGTSPTAWTGSTRILLQYLNTGVPVSFAQCWVFAGVFNTFLRCLGLPSRVITNFSSAHDNTGNLKTDLIFRMDGTPDRRNTRDSIWNYHCWNELWMVRHDLPANLGGWQVVDATPQETSDGLFRCGPTSVAAIKEGLLCHPFDAGFVFAEVNSDVVHHKRDRYGTLTPFRVDKHHVGQLIYTKAVGGSGTLDLTHTYKYPEGSAEDSMTMARAEEYGCVRDHSELAEDELLVSITNEPCFLGQDLYLAVEFQNQGEAPKTVLAKLSASVIFYTGVSANSFKDQKIHVIVQGHQTERVLVKILAQEYQPHLGAQASLNIVLTGQADEQSLSAMKIVDLMTPQLTMAVSGVAQVGQQMFVMVSFTNTFNFPLQNAQLSMEGPGLMSVASRRYRSIEPQASISWTETFSPRLDGHRRLVAVMDCSNLSPLWGAVDVLVSA